VLNEDFIKEWKTTHTHNQPLKKMFRGCHETKNQPSIKSLFLTTTAVFEEYKVNHFFLSADNHQSTVITVINL
jgi:hypothetical protein